jgi:rsbT co-antagonist protein RsbR
MYWLRLSQRQINFGLMIFLTLTCFAQEVFFVSIGNPLVVAYGIATLVCAALALAYRRGWEPARFAIVITSVVLIAVFLEEPFLTHNLALEIFFPPVVALILTRPVWVVGSGVLLIGLIAVRTGGQTNYLSFDNLVTYFMIIGGMVFSRLAIDNAERLAEANTQAESARSEAEQRAIELEQRNAELQSLLAENAAQREAIRELNVPLLPVANDTLVLPLVGLLDATRLLLVQERMLATVYERRAHAVIIDVTGVPMIDAQAAHGLAELIQAVRLLGARVLLVGIRSNVAEALVGLELELNELSVDRDVQAALAHLWGTTSVSSQ